MVELNNKLMNQWKAEVVWKVEGSDPPEYKGIAEGSFLTSEEAQEVAKVLRDECIQKGLNVVRAFSSHDM